MKCDIGVAKAAAGRMQLLNYRRQREIDDLLYLVGI
jgi:hypothetical protein